MPRRPGSSDSASSADTFQSALSEDSYLGSLVPGLDDQFKTMLNEVKMVENHRKFVKERKIQSHKAKKLDPADIGRRTDWSDQQNEDWSSYKEKVLDITEPKRQHDASVKAAKESRGADLSTLETARNKALDDGVELADVAVTAAVARLGFMTKYPKAFDCKSTINHLKSAADNLNSAKKAMREVVTQKKKIAEAKALFLRNVRKASKPSA